MKEVAGQDWLSSVSMDFERFMSHQTSHHGSIQRLTEQIQTFAGLGRYSSAGFLVALVVLLVVTPLIETLSQATLIESVLLTVVLGSAVFAVGADRRSLALGVLLSLPAVVLKWAEHFFPGAIPSELVPAASMIFVSFVIFRLMRFILRAAEVNTDVLCAGIAAYLTLGLLWGFAYLLVSRAAPSSFSIAGAPGVRILSGFDALYFSYVTLTTVGFGDITPVSPAARMLAALEALSGTIYMAVLVARLVSQHSTTIQFRAS